MKPANDKKPRLAAEFTDLAARRAWLDGLPDTRYRGQRTNRIEQALVAEASPLVATLRQVRELMRPAEICAVDLGDGDDEDSGDRNTGFGAEMKHNQSSFTPSIPKLLRAYADGIRIGTSFYRDKGGETVTIGGTLPGASGRMKFRGLQFYRGALVAYGDDKGRKRKPKYVGTKSGVMYGKDSETARHIDETQANNASYLKLTGAPANDNAPRAREAPTPTKSAAAARVALAGVANDNVQVTHCPDGMAYGYGRLAGISDSAGHGATTAPRHAALDELDRAETFASMELDSADVELIEAVLSGESFRTIGLRFGYAESSAHRSGRQVVERALEKISKKIAA
ncbi:hypothetical protein [Hoeflea alexandrii]|uniref:hypothetical protein n=1 Tax=Hoeflea alexandrii TaxID=288436 RepID=UPI0022B0014D|nr:hypothetical protein [Hoeflea alexandrii]MCZ4287868.1 hypothetical protein [Hoeflea alexandrii]